MSAPRLCTWRHVEADRLRCAGRGYLRYAWRDRDGDALLRARGVWGDHAPVLRWVPRAAPEVARRGRPLLTRQSVVATLPRSGPIGHVGFVVSYLAR